MSWTRRFAEVGLSDIPSVGGKNASLGELLRELAPLGVAVPDGFAVTADAYRHFMRESGLEPAIRKLVASIKPGDVNGLVKASEEIRRLIVSAKLPDDLERDILQGYAALSEQCGVAEADVAVRSSATAEDLPDASFAGQQDTYLNIQGGPAVLDAVKRCFASLFTARAMSYRADLGFDHFDVALSVGVQKMVRSDLASSGVIFTLDTESGHRDMVLLTASYGLGEAVVQGQVVPDQFYVHKPTLMRGKPSLFWKRLGSKESKLVYASEGPERIRSEETRLDERRRYSLTDAEVLQLAKWAVQIEQHYRDRKGSDCPMDIEWGKDGQTGQLYVLQARPETVHSRKASARFRLYKLKGTGTVLTTGLAVGEGVAVGKARVIKSPSQMGEFQPGEILVTGATDPDWEPIMKIAAGIVTERGGRTSHAAIVARELGIPAVLGTGDATTALATGQTVTLSCAEGEQGHLYEGALEYDVEEVDKDAVARPRTEMLLNVGSPEQAMQASQLPSQGVGLARMEFIFASWVRVHPLALTRYEQLPADVRAQVDEVTWGYETKTEYFVDKLAQGIGTIAAAFYPRPVILRLSDFKSNEYARLLGGAQFEPSEENPMLGWRGASRYYHPNYKEGFMLEVAAVRRVRETWGLTNLKVMVPFCRTPAEGRKVIETLREGGLVQGKDGLEVYVMAELPSNFLLADEFARIFDGFSIGSNDMTQLVLGVDRDGERVAPLFDERNPAVKEACARVIAAGRRAGKKVGICGQAPSDFPDFAAFLVEQGIHSISLNPDAVIKTSERVLAAEKRMARRLEDDEELPEVSSEKDVADGPQTGVPFLAAADE